MVQGGRMSEELRRKLRQRRHICEGEHRSPGKVILARHEPSELEEMEAAEVEVDQYEGRCCRDTQQADPQGFDAMRQFSVTDELGNKLRRQLQLAEGCHGGRCFEAGAQPSGSGNRSGSDRPIAGTGESPARSGHTEYYSLDASDSPPRSAKSVARSRTFRGSMAAMLISLAACMTTLIGVPAWVSQSQEWYDVQLYTDMRLRSIMSSVIEWPFSRDVHALALDKASANSSRESDTAMGSMVVREPPPVGGNPQCWHGGYTWEICCSPELGPAGNGFCWDTIYTFHHCCLGGAGDLPTAAMH